jgi:hypothetical protein
MLVKKLFDDNTLHSLHPDNVIELKPGVVSPFSDYYGALLDVEVLVRDRIELSESQQREFTTVLANNLFVPNYKTPRGRLNDRIRKLAGDSGVLGARSLSSLVNRVVYEKERVEKAHQFGLSSNDIQESTHAYAHLVHQVRDFGDLLQHVMFSLQPTTGNPSTQAVSTLHLLKGAILNEDDERYQDFRGQIVQLCSEAETGTPQGKKFFFRGEEYTSTKGFVREWTRVIKEKERLDAIILGKKKTNVGRRNFVGGLMAIATGVGVLYAAPSLRHTLHMGVSDVERVQLLIDQGRYEPAVELAKTLPKDKLYWQARAGMIMVTTQLKELNTKKSFNLFERFSWTDVKSMLQNGPWGWFESAESFYFDNGFIKVGDRYKVTEGNVATSYVIELLRPSSDTILEPEEHKLLDKMVKGDVLYMGEKKGKECFGIIINSRESYIASLGFENGKIAEIEFR